MNKAGFTLIELTLALLLSSMLATILYTIFKQTSFTVRSTETSIEQVRELVRLQQLLYDDLAAAFALTFPEDEKEKIIDRIFFSTNSDDRLKLLTFLTTHHLPIFGSVMPSRVRVVYRLQESATPGLFTLMRQEASNLNFKEFEGAKIRGYEIIDRIKKLNVTFYVREPDNKEEPKKDNKVPKYLEFAEWGTDEQQKKIKEALKPEFALIKGVWVDMLNKEHAFEQRIQLFSEPQPKVQKTPLVEQKPPSKPPLPPKGDDK